VSRARPRLAVFGYAAIERIPGPGGAQIALAAARQGAAPALFAAIGDDWPRRWTEALEAAGVDVSGLERRYGPTRRNRPVAAGACEAQVDRGHAWRRRTEALFPPAPKPGFDGYLACPAPLRGVALTVAAARGAFVCAETDGLCAAGPIQGPEAFAGVAMVAAEPDEAMALTGLDDPDAAAEALRAVAPVVVLRRGREGLERFAAEGRLRHAPPAHARTDAAGAGGAAAGALAAAVLLGETPARQLERAVEAETLAFGGGAVGLGLEF
jgi:sugar/nucleoside kinase (ribokinase family)